MSSRGLGRALARLSGRLLPQGTAARLGVIFSALFILTLGPLVAVTVMLTSGWLETALDEHLLEVAHDVAARMEREGSEPELVVERLSAPSQLVELRAVDGSPALLSPLVDSPIPIPPRSVIGAEPVLQTVTLERGRLRVIAYPLPDNAAGYAYTVVATPVPDLGRETRQLIALLLGIGALALVVALLATWLMSRWLTRPLRELVASVGRNAESDFAEDIVLHDRASSEVRAVADAIRELSERHHARLERERAFFADSSHVLRTPLAVLQGNVDLLEHAADERERRDALEQARSAVRSISRTVSGLLLLSRREPAVPDRQVVDLTELVRRAAAGFQRAWPDRPLVCDGLERIAVLGDEHDLREAIDAITENAARYSRPGTPVTIRCCRDGARAVVAVIDEGIGLSPDEARRATERFFRGYEARVLAPGGTGLGLAIAQRIVHMHQGALTLEPRTDRRGALARIELPLFD